MKNFDIDEAAAFLKKNLSAPTAAKIVSSDSLYSLLDYIFLIYEREGMMDIDLEGDDLSEEELAEKAAKKNPFPEFSKEDYIEIFKAERAYEDSLFDD